MDIEEVISEVKEKFAMDAQEVYRTALEDYFSKIKNIDPSRFEVIREVLDSEWEKVLKNPRLVKVGQNGKPIARILEDENRIPYFDLSPT